MRGMANAAYLSAWLRDFAEENMGRVFERLLEAVPFSAGRPGFEWLMLRAVNAAEAPLVEHDLRQRPATAEQLLALASDQLHADTSLETRAWWDLWAFDLASGRWEQQPQPLVIVCSGAEYDDGAYREAGHFCVEIGFEHLFTGHAGLLGRNGTSAPAAPHPAEVDFLAHMAEPAHLREYHEKTRENIRTLLNWMAHLEKMEEVERCRLWSEGEENFEARLDEILAHR
jgi:hypothetical protein